MPTERKIQILIADNHELVRCGLKTLLAGTEIKIVAEATTVQAALKLALEKDFDVVLLDVRLPDGDVRLPWGGSSSTNRNSRC